MRSLYGLLLMGGMSLSILAAANPPSTERVSVGTGGIQANNYSFQNSISGDGSVVAFLSAATNFAPGDNNFTAQIFRRDLKTDTTEIVSVNANGDQSNGTNDDPVISADGRFVAYMSMAGNLMPGDISGQDVFVYDAVTKTNEIVSTSSSGMQPGHTGVWPRISAGGRFVIFSSDASNVVPGDTNGQPDYFLRDRVTQTTERVSVGSGGVQGNSWSGRGDISGDGRFVAFDSYASNLVPDDTNGQVDVFVHDRLTNETTRISVASDGHQANAGSAQPRISDDGRWVAFQSVASNLVPNDTNGDCKRVFNDQCMDVFVHDRATGVTTRVSQSTEGVEADGHNWIAAISGNGRFVAFTSYAGNLVPGDTNVACETGFDAMGDDQCPDVYVHDLVTGVTARASLSNAGLQTMSDSCCSDISQDGRFVSFESGGNDLVAGDTNQASDVFMRDLGDSDGDGEWDPFDPCTALPGNPDLNGDLKPDHCEAPGSGNVDCSKVVDAIDALQVLRYAVGLSVSQSEPCLDLGLALTNGQLMADVDCSQQVNSVDALKILRAITGLPVAHPPACSPIVAP